MAASLFCSSTALASLQERLCSPSSSSSMQSQNGRFVPQKEILGASLLPHRDIPVCEDNYCRPRRRLIVEAAKRLDRGRTLLLSSTLKANEADVDKVAKLCDGIREWASAYQKNQNAGLKRFECYVDTFESNVFHFIEEYSSLVHMNDSKAAPEHTQFWNDVRPFLLEPIALAAYEYKDGNIGHMLNPIGPKGEGGLDDATGQGGKGGEEYMKPKPKKRTLLEGTEGSDGKEPLTKEEGGKVPEDPWSFDKILAKVVGTYAEKSEKDSTWSLRSLFGAKK